MADFDIQITSGASVKDFLDDRVPSRLNPPAEYPHRYWHVLHTAATVRFSVSLDDGTLEPVDGALGGDLFRWSWVERPLSVGELAIPSPAGLSSVAEFTAAAFTGREGYHLLRAERDNHGSLAIPFFVSTTP